MDGRPCQPIYKARGPSRAKLGERKASREGRAVSADNNEIPLREVVAGQLRSLILGGELKPGERLVEGQLAERLGVSRNPVREAMRSLEATGLIEVVPRRGAHVSTIDPCAVHHIQHIRILVEGYAVEQAAQRQDPDGIERIRRCLEDGRRATERGEAVAAAFISRSSRPPAFPSSIRCWTLFGTRPRWCSPSSPTSEETSLGRSTRPSTRRWFPVTPNAPGNWCAST